MEVNPDKLVAKDDGKIEVKIIEKCSYHAKWSYSLLYYPEYDRLVSSGFDSEIFIYNTSRKLVEKRICEHSKCIRKIFKSEHDKDTFISVSGDGNMFSFSIKRMEMVKKVFQSRHGLFRSTEPKNSRIVLASYFDELYFLDLPKTHIAKNIYSHKCDKLSSDTVLRFSKIDHNLVYYNFNRLGKANIHVLDTSKRLDVLKFEIKEMLSYTIEVYLNNRNEEILVVGGNSSIVKFYNMLFKEPKCFLDLDMGSDTQTVQSFGDLPFLFYGDFSGGYIGLFRTDNFQSIFFNRRIHINGVKEFCFLESLGDTLRFASCGYDNMVNIFEVRNFPFVVDDFSKRDLEERRNFLLCEFNEYVDLGDTELKNRIMVSIKCLNCLIGEILRIFLVCE